MATLPLDLDGLLASAPDGDTGAGMVAGTRIGHVHLQVASIPEADEFYVGQLGFDPIVRRYPGALFVSAGGYHHHIGLNTWAGEGIPAPPPDARGLRSFTIVLPDDAALSATLEAAAAAGVEIDLADGRRHGHGPVRQRGRPDDALARYRVTAAAARACRSYWLAA